MQYRIEVRFSITLALLSRLSIRKLPRDTYLFYLRTFIIHRTDRPLPLPTTLTARRVPYRCHVGLRSGFAFFLALLNRPSTRRPPEALILPTYEPIYLRTFATHYIDRPKGAIPLQYKIEVRFLDFPGSARSIEHTEASPRHIQLLPITSTA